MRRTLILTLAFVAGVAVCDASAQSAAPPVELGLDVSTHGSRRLSARIAESVAAPGAATFAMSPRLVA
jgi:hypothetical protein